MIDATAFVYMVGIMVAGALLYVIGINIESFNDGRSIRKQIKKRVAVENQQFLMEQAVYEKKPKRSHYHWLYLTPVGIAVALLATLQVEGGTTTTAMFPWAGTLVIPFVTIHLLAFIAMGFWVFLIGFGTRDTLRTNDFLTEEEMDLLMYIEETMATRGEGVLRTALDNLYSREFDEDDILHFSVYVPEALIPVLKQREELAKYIQVRQEFLRMERTDASLLKPEQVSRNEAIKKEFTESLQRFEPLLQNVANATSRQFMEEELKKKLDKQKIQQDFDEKQRGIEQQLSALKGIVQNKNTPQTTDQPLPESMLELYRVAKSETVSPELREEAADLLERIEEMQEQDKNRQKREMSDMEAVAVIKANALLHRLEDDGRAS